MTEEQVNVLFVVHTDLQLVSNNKYRCTFLLQMKINKQDTFKKNNPQDLRNLKQI